ncbi:hypothetical protein DTO280E4_649 [Paecilomyces variotii]|nr:hypothetical protein DTO169C6_8939 [Paecilomyces variotii]KAJ9256889.1 hypothetical protein DTO195F2_5714 [Paecilomyces variotii]KAJ9263506.1 hypothetical protein DTO212C5_7523 [Paecilomyces variotii]KAJ9365680.1 hypothetical protein DTO280E4_649 [Paecilomyces variotii]KAJ9366103.1 hypothetical protein DTO282E5_9209 [Paecilomyces variotii]
MPAVFFANNFRYLIYLFFSAENWTLRKLVDKSRVTNEKTVQVFWLSSNGPRKYVGKVFPDYTKEQAR